MSFTQLYFSFDGRISRSTFWLKGVLVLFVLSMVIAFIDAAVEAGGILYLIWALVLIWANIAIQVKRWHDRDKSGWWMFIALIPIIGGLWTLIETGFLAGTEGPNQYGERPY